MITKLVTDLNDKQKIYRFRYEVYVEEMNRKQDYCDHISKTIIEPIDDTASLFAAFDQNENVIGTLRLPRTKPSYRIG